MESYLEYLAFLSWQTPLVRLEDFKKVFQNQEDINSAEDILTYLSHPEMKLWTKMEKNWWKQAEESQKNCRVAGIKTVWPFHPDYPEALFKMEHPPALISWKGQVSWNQLFLLAVVGSRHPYQDTLLWMDTHFSLFLKRRKEKLAVVSGGARGVDQKAHALALAHQKPTLCFLPCGIQNYYPSALQKWEKHIIDGGGALVSVFPFSAPMQKSYFHVRNKVIAYLSHLLFIAQAQLRSGTMVTARYALHAGSNIAVLPGSPLYTGYGGSLSLINDGCFMIRDHLDLETLYQSCALSTSKL